MLQRKASRRTIGLLTSALAGLGAFVVAVPSAQAMNPVVPSAGPSVSNLNGVLAPLASPQVGFIAQASGTYAYNSGRNIVHGPSAQVTVACTSATGQKRTANAVAADLRGLGRTGATETVAQTVADGGKKSSVSYAHTEGGQLLNGLVKWGAITSKAVATTDGYTYTPKHSSKIASLRVAGVPVDVGAGPNTKIELKIPRVGSIGEIVINEQSAKWIGDEYKVNTTALHVAILKDNPLGLKVGTHVFVSQTRSSLLKPMPGFLAGGAFGTRLTLANGVVKHGPTSQVALKCLGGKSKNTIATGDVADLADAGAIQAQAEGKVTTSETSGTAQVETATADILNKLVSADAIKAVASVKRGKDGKIHLSDKGSQLVNVKVAGLKLGDNIGPNTSLEVKGLGKVTLRKVVKTKTSITVTMIEVVIGQKGLAYPLGTKLEIAQARAEIRK